MPEVTRLDRLQKLYGAEITLIADDGSEETYRIAAEFRVGETVYAALQTPAMRKADEAAFYHVIDNANGLPELESIDDEDEWEAAAEAYDELLFAEHG
ncbi:DUF1292 domain-containing protein [Paenibacillaceae bacterium]|nr:DUF1292 domain-containing protein [Paenibacillaceae bacterium]